MRRLLALVCLAGLGAVGSAAASPSAHPGGCGPSGAGVHTLARSSSARVYTDAGRVLGCAFQGRRTSFLLGHTGVCIGQDRVDPVALSGRMVAFGSERCGVDTGSTEVVVRRLSDGHVVSDTEAATVPGPESYTTVTAMRVRSDGAVAWIAEATSIIASGHRIEVRVVDAGGSRLLDSGPQIGLHSLRLTGHRISWLHGTQLRTAHLA